MAHSAAAASAVSSASASASPSASGICEGSAGQEQAGGWRFAIDRGGTFTDLVGRSPCGSLVVRKVLSEPATSAAPHLADPAVAAIRSVLGLAPASPLPAGLVEEVRLGTTVATNALLERRLEPVLLLVNRGYADVALIGDQHRPDIFALRIERPEPPAMRVLEVEARLAADGRELVPFRPTPELESQLLEARAAGLRSCAVALLHAVVNPAHELALGAWLERLGFDPVLLSHRIGGLPRLLPRLHTTLVEAAVRPVLRRYLSGVQACLGPHTRLRVMTSAGVLQSPDQLLAKDTILSGPAGGVVGAVAVARAAGLAAGPIIGFDMGGTSTDVFHLEAGCAAGSGEPRLERASETTVAGLRLQAPTLPIHTVAAGGGSVIALEGGRLQVGPRSAGSDPGPACYRRGGPLTISDANLLLGRLPAGSLPSVFGPDGDQPPDGAVVRQGFAALAACLAACQPAGTAPPTPEAVAEGARTIALERMAEAIRRISIQRGHDIRAAVLVSYGGAGGQHACALAERLGIARVLLHPLAGVLSAHGIGLSRQESLRGCSVQRPLCDALLPELIQRRDALLFEAAATLRAAGDAASDPCEAILSLVLRPEAGERGLELPWNGTDSAADLRQAYEERHRQRFGHVVAGEALVVERLQLLLPAARRPDPLAQGDGSASAAAPTASAVPPTPRLEPLWLAAGGAAGAASLPVRRQVPCWRRQELHCGQRLEGPALVLEPTGTTVLEPGWGGRVLADGALLLEPLRPVLAASPADGATGGTADAAAENPAGTPHADAGQSAGLTAPGGGSPGAGRAAAIGTRRSEQAGGMTASGAPGAAGSQAATAGAVGTDAADGRADGKTDRPMDWQTEEQTEELPQEQVEGLPEGQAPDDAAAAGAAADPVQLELYNHRFSAIAEQMGVRLQQSSRSVNIRERLDFSCALFDAAGRLVANAPHIPVHLGSMGESVASLLAAIARGERPPLQPGDAVACNDPYAGGTHLPDITVISAVFAPAAHQEGGTAPLAYVASRGHHADVGGITPGSMPPFSRSIHEEGLRLDNVSLIRAGVLQTQEWQRRMAAGAHPVRDPERLLADLQAQVAANRLGEAELQRLILQRGPAELTAYMAHVQHNAAAAVRAVIERLQPGRHSVALDDGSRIVVAVRPDRRRRRITVDFSGTSPQQPGNLNAPLAITRAVVLYVFRVLVARPIPLNAGCFAPIDLIVPPGCLLHPVEPAAVVGGNVETSQAVANALFAALGVLAHGQGTMNNLSFGNDRCQYYETVAGGAGAGMLADGSGFAGCSAVQTHMTNSRLTDPEILEARFPVRLERFALRRGSGGVGRFPGGDGVVRELTALEPLTLAILSGSRRVAPRGGAGGGPGRCGRNTLIRADGRREPLGGAAQVAMAAGDRFLLETPGGGAWGAAADSGGGLTASASAGADGGAGGACSPDATAAVAAAQAPAAWLQEKP